MSSGHARTAFAALKLTISCCEAGPLRRQLEKQQSSGKQAASGTPRTSPQAAEGVTGEQRPRQDSVEAGGSTRAEQKPRLKRIEKHRDSALHR